MPSGQTPTLGVANQDFLLFDEQDGGLHHQSSPPIPSYMQPKPSIVKTPSATLAPPMFEPPEDETASSRGSISPQQPWQNKTQYYTPPTDVADGDLNGDYPWSELFDDPELTSSLGIQQQVTPSNARDAQRIVDCFPELYGAQSGAAQQISKTAAQLQKRTQQPQRKSTAEEFLDFAEKERKYQNLPPSQTVSPKDAFLDYNAETRQQPSLFGVMDDLPSTYPSPQASEAGDVSTSPPSSPLLSSSPEETNRVNTLKRPRRPATRMTPPDADQRAKRQNVSSPEEMDEDDEVDVGEIEADDSDEYSPSGEVATKRRRVTRSAGITRSSPQSTPKRKPPHPRNNGATRRSKKSQTFKCTEILPDGSVCGVSFARPYDRIRHEKTVHEETPAEKFTCDLCADNRSFSRHDALIRHRRVKHNRRS